MRCMSKTERVVLLKLRTKVKIFSFKAFEVSSQSKSYMVPTAAVSRPSARGRCSVDIELLK